MSRADSSNSLRPADSDEPIRILQILRPLLRYRQIIFAGTLVMTGLTLVVGGWYFLMQPTRWSASLGFRPMFDGAERGQYPNGLAFLPSDVTDASVADQVFDANRIEDYCDRADFRSGLVSETGSSDLEALDLDFQARLSDPKINAIERQRIQEEYQARRSAVALQYRLEFVRVPGCQSLPPAVGTKVLTDVLQTWAHDADVKRGVMRVRVAVLTPAIFDTTGERQSLLVRSDLVRSALVRLSANIRQVQAIAGSETIRLAGPGAASFNELRVRTDDLVQARLDPLVSTAGRALGSESERWVEESLKSTTADYDAAMRRADAYRQALMDYSGVSAAPSAGIAAQRQGSSADVQTLTPQIDRTFIDRIVEMSSANAMFRQELTRKLVDASINAVAASAAVDHYKQLLLSIKGGARADGMSTAAIEDQLAQIVQEGKGIAQQFGKLYEELSRVSLRSGSMMYRIEQPVQVFSIRPFSRTRYVALVFLVLLLSPFVLALICLGHHYLYPRRGFPAA